MSLLRRRLLEAVAALSLAVLGWDAWQPRADAPRSVPEPAPAPTSPASRDALTDGPPHFTHLTADRVLRPGQRLTVHARVRGLTPDGPTTLSMEGPDGTMASVELRGNETREAVFTLEHPTPALAPGAFTWTLRLPSSHDPVILGVHVAEADRPRVLLLLDHPGVEGARLQRWLTEAGSSFTARTRVSTDRYRVASSPGTAVDLDRLEAPAMASFDVVVAHAAAVERLSPGEHAALDLALRGDGLGLLILGSHAPGDGASNQDPPTPTPAAGLSESRLASAGSPLVTPWLRQWAPTAEAPAGLRETRVHLVNGVHLESPVSVLAAELELPPGGHTLARDPQDRPLVATSALGRGQVACSIVLDTWRWRQHGRVDDYAHFWSTLLSALARPLPTSSPAWSMNNASLPAFVDRPVSLVWSGPPNTPLPAAAIRSHGMPSASAVSLNLDRSPSEPTQSRATFWPEHPGWHTLRALPSGPTFDFYVHAASALPWIRAQEDNDTARHHVDAAIPDPTVDPVPSQAAGARPWLRLTALALFVFSVARLWYGDASARLRKVASPLTIPP